MINVTDATFVQEVLQSPTPVVVDFYADWCAPCKAIAPTFAALENEISGTKFVKVNIDETDIAMQYGVRGIPTLIVFKDGKPVSQATGGAVMVKSRMADFINKAVE